MRKVYLQFFLKNFAIRKTNLKLFRTFNIKIMISHEDFFHSWHNRIFIILMCRLMSCYKHVAPILRWKIAKAGGIYADLLISFVFFSFFSQWHSSFYSDKISFKQYRHLKLRSIDICKQLASRNANFFKTYDHNHICSWIFFYPLCNKKSYTRRKIKKHLDVADKIILNFFVWV